MDMWHVCIPTGEPTRNVWPYPALLCSTCMGGTRGEVVNFDPRDGLPVGFSMVRMRVAVVPRVDPPQITGPPRPPRLERVHPNYPTYPGWVRLYPCVGQHYFSQPPVLPQPDEGTLLAQARDGKVEFSVDGAPPVP